MTKLVTSIYLDEDLKRWLSENDINLSKLIDDAIRERRLLGVFSEENYTLFLKHQPLLVVESLLNLERGKLRKLDEEKTVFLEDFEREAGLLSKKIELILARRAEGIE